MFKNSYDNSRRSCGNFLAIFSLCWDGDVVMSSAGKGWWGFILIEFYITIKPVASKFVGLRGVNSEINRDFLDLTGIYRTFEINCKFGKWYRFWKVRFLWDSQCICKQHPSSTQGLEIAFRNFRFSKMCELSHICQYGRKHFTCIVVSAKVS